MQRIVLENIDKKLDSTTLNIRTRNIVKENDLLLCE